MKKITKIVSVFLFISAVLSSEIATCFADGMMLSSDKPYWEKGINQWDYTSESEQNALINYENGQEKLILSIGTKKQDANSSVWIFPIPTKPGDAKISYLDEIPSIKGEEQMAETQININRYKPWFYYSQIYPYLLSWLKADEKKMLGTVDMYNSLDSSSTRNEEYVHSANDIIVYQHIEKDQLSSELLESSSIDALYNYLKEKEIDIDRKKISVFDQYVKSGYSFVVTWISPVTSAVSGDNSNSALSIETITKNYQDYFNLPKYPKTVSAEIEIINRYDEFKNNRDIYTLFQTNEQLKKDLINYIFEHPDEFKAVKNVSASDKTNYVGLFVAFKTDKIFFPLIPSSVYGNDRIPINIRVIGWHSPESKKPIWQSFYSPESKKKILFTTYYSDAQTDDLMAKVPDFYTGKSSTVNYTRINIDTQAKYLVDDLYINNNAPFYVIILQYFNEYPFVSAIILYLLISLISSIIIGILVFGWNKNSDLMRYGLFGLANIFTIVGVLISIILYKIPRKHDEVIVAIKQLNERGCIGKRNLRLILFVLGLPLLIVNITHIIHLLIVFKGLGIITDYDNFPNLCIYSFAQVAYFLFAWFVTRVKSADIDLFNVLKKHNQSTYFFTSDLNKKLIFVSLFSLVFLLVSYYTTLTLPESPVSYLLNYFFGVDLRY